MQKAGSSILVILLLAFNSGAYRHSGVECAVHDTDSMEFMQKLIQINALTGNYNLGSHRSNESKEELVVPLAGRMSEKASFEGSDVLSKTAKCNETGCVAKAGWDKPSWPGFLLSITDLRGTLGQGEKIRVKVNGEFIAGLVCSTEKDCKTVSGKSSCLIDKDISSYVKTSDNKIKVQLKTNNDEMRCANSVKAEITIKPLHTTTITTDAPTTGPPAFYCHVLYLMADNNLDDAISEDLEELIANTAALEHPSYYPLVYIDRKHYSWNEPITGLKNEDGADEEYYTGVRYIEQDFTTNNLKVSQRLGEKNSDDPNTLQHFLQWAFPKCIQMNLDSKILLQFSSHGLGWYGFGHDENTALLLQMQTLKNDQIRSSISEALGLLSPPRLKLDLLGFDACLMQSYSSLYVYDTVTKWYMASEEVEPAHGWDYASVDPESATVKDFAVEIINNFATTKHGSSYHEVPKTLSVISDQKFADFKVAMDELADAMVDFMASWGRVFEEVRTHAKELAYETVSGYSVDLGDFLKQLFAACQVYSCPADLEGAAGLAEVKYRAMISQGYYAAGPGTDAEFTGMAIYFPALEGEYNSGWVKHWKEGGYGFAAAKDRAWQKFLTAYHSRPHSSLPTICTSKLLDVEDASFCNASCTSAPSCHADCSTICNSHCC